MMALLLLFYWVVLPLLAGLLAWRLWRLASTPLTKGLVATASAAGFAWLFWFLAGGEQWLVDRQVRELCAKDGGVKVYETVRLPGDEYDQYAKRNWILPDKVRAKPEDKYYAEMDRHYYLKGNPEMSRIQYRIIRRDDGKILGESISYGRGGGDLPGPWHGSSFRCPSISEDRPSLEASVFLRGSEK